MSARRKHTTARAAARDLNVPIEHIQDVCDYYPADDDIWCDRLRVTTWDWLTGETSWIDWRPTGPPAAGTRGWPDGKKKKNASGRPALPMGLVTVTVNATNRVLVVEGLTDWMAALHMFPTSGVVGAPGLTSIPNVVGRLVAMGIDAGRIVIVIDHDPPEKVGARRAAWNATREVRLAHPAVSVLRPEPVGWDMRDGWLAHGPDWAAAVAVAVRDVRPGRGTAIPAPTTVRPSPLRPSSATHTDPQPVAPAGRTLVVAPPPGAQGGPF